MAEEGRLLNLSVGVLGHVDCGKTALVRLLSTVLSTAALDRAPQARERGMTLDLGFSAFAAAPSEHLRSLGVRALQVTLVDCPGHAALVRTVIGAAQILDLALLVVDAQRGVQTQTAECLVIAEIALTRLVVVLNKTDLLPVEDRAERLARVTQRVRKVLAATRFVDAPIVSVSALEDGCDSEGVRALTELIRRAADSLPLPAPAPSSAPFRLAVDHCFAVKGHGTVVTGTVLRGALSAGQSLEFPLLGLERRVKSIQSFHVSVRSCGRGDRVGLCVPGLDSALLERGVACAPGRLDSLYLPGDSGFKTGDCTGSMARARALLCQVRRVRFFDGALRSGGKAHVTVGHDTQLCACVFFGAAELLADPGLSFSLDAPALAQELLEEGPQWAALTLPRASLCDVGDLVLGSRLDTAAADKCRLAFHGTVVRLLTEAEASSLRLYRCKSREGVVDRVLASRDGLCTELVARGLQSRDVGSALGMRVRTESGFVGVVKGEVAGGARVLLSQGARQVRAGQRLCLRYRRFAGGAVEQGDEADAPVELDLEPEPEPVEDVKKPPKKGKRAVAKGLGPSPGPAAGPVADPAAGRRGLVESVRADVVVVSGLFSAEEDVRPFAGRRLCAAGQTGLLVGPFAKMGKVRATFEGGFAGAVGAEVRMLDDSNCPQPVTTS